jgi:hypothetical protein
MTTTSPREAWVDTFLRASAETADARLVADQFIAAGWRPPLPAAQVEIDDEADAWYVRVLDVAVHHTTESAPVNLDWTRDGTLIGVELLGRGEVPRPARCGCADAERLYDELEQAYVSACTERDALSLLLRGMARKLVATRGQARLQAALSLEINQGWVAYRERTKARRRQFLDDIATLTGERDTLEKILSKERSRVAAALALIDGGTSAGPHFLSPDQTRAVRAALVGDQPPAEATLECPHCRSLIRATSGAITQLDVDTHLAACQPARQFARECATAALSGVALRDVEEADDASEPDALPLADRARMWLDGQADDAAGDLP